jgi:hypothetical protein
LAKVRTKYIGFEDVTRPDQRTFGFYEVKVLGTSFSQVIRASHPTACRLARSRTQYGQAELSFLEPIDTPAID